MEEYYAKTKKYVPLTKDVLFSRLTSMGLKVLEEIEIDNKIFVVEEDEILRPEYEGDNIVFIGYQISDLELGAKIDELLEEFGLSADEGAEYI